MAQVVANNVVHENNPYVQSVYYRVGSGPNSGYARVGAGTLPAGVDAANQYLLSSFQGGNAPDVVAFCKEDAAFVTPGAASWKGNHGGGAWQSQHVPLIISGPGVSRGVISHYPARLEDIAPTALSLFGITSTGMQGSILADARINPTRRDLVAQRALSKTLSPLVQSLMAQSSLELKAEAGHS